MPQEIADGLGFPDVGENFGRAIDEHYANHHQQQHGEHKHDLLRLATKVNTDEVGQVGTAMAYGKHAAHIVVDSTCKDASEDNPQIGHRTKLGSKNGSKDRACAGNVQELNHEHFPVGHGDEVNTIGLGHGWGRAVVRTKHLFDELSIDEIAQDEGYQ